MLTAIIAFCAGLVVGWNLLAQPEWVKRLYDRINPNHPDGF